MMPAVIESPSSMIRTGRTTGTGDAGASAVVGLATTARAGPASDVAMMIAIMATHLRKRDPIEDTRLFSAGMYRRSRRVRASASAPFQSLASAQRAHVLRPGKRRRAFARAIASYIL